MFDQNVPPAPHYLPGYTGHCPRYKYLQESRGQPHRLRFNPSVRTLESKPEAQPSKLTLTEIDYVRAHSRDPDYEHPTEPGPQCFLPFLNERLGKKELVDQYNCIAQREKQIVNEKCHKALLQSVSAMDEKDEKFVTMEDLQTELQPEPGKAEIRIKKNHIYRKDAGLIPKYSGHVPGAIFKFGTSFGNATINAKKWLKQGKSDSTREN